MMSLTYKEISIEEHYAGKVIAVKVSGKLSKEDYEVLAPEVERQIAEHGKIRMLIELEDFHGWQAGALWEDIKFDAKHFNDLERLAVVGEKKWEQGMTLFCKPFTTAAVRYFDHNKRSQAEAWITEGLKETV